MIDFIGVEYVTDNDMMKYDRYSFMEDYWEDNRNV